MLEFLTGAGLALSAGLNAYIPLLALGLASRFLDFVELPQSWLWLENEWVLGILGWVGIRSQRPQGALLRKLGSAGS